MATAAARMVLLQGRVLGQRCCRNSHALKHLQAAGSGRHLSVTSGLRYLSGFAGWPLPQAGDYSTNAKMEAYSIRRMSAATEPTTQSDIIERIKHDHEELEEYYSNYKKAHQRGDHDEAYKWFNQFVWEISRHAVSEELVLYPLIASQGERGKDLADQSRTDHQQTKNILEELQNITDPDLFDQKVDEMMSELREHIKKEESQDLVYLQEHVSQSGREVAGTTFSLGKNLVPTRPHAGVPNKPAALEAALGLLITPVDKIRDIFTPFPSKS